MRRAAFALLLIATTALGAAAPEPEGYWTGPINSLTPATLRGGAVIHARELAEMQKTDAPVVINVSNAPTKPAGLPAQSLWMPLPQESIPGSEWLPGVGMGVVTPQVEAHFRSYLSRATRGDLDYPIVIYCHERCWLSWNAAKRAISYGYRRVWWFPEGVEGWRAAGYSTVQIKAPSEEAASRASP